MEQHLLWGMVGCGRSIWAYLLGRHGFYGEDYIEARSMRSNLGCCHSIIQLVLYNNWVLCFISLFKSIVPPHFISFKKNCNTWIFMCSNTYIFIMLLNLSGNVELQAVLLRWNRFWDKRKYWIYSQERNNNKRPPWLKVISVPKS